MSTITDFDLLEDLCRRRSLSGFEHEATAFFLEYLKNDIDDGYHDLMGNAVAVISQESAASRIMIEAHADEIGFQVLHIADSGYIYIRRVGGIDEICLPGQQVIIQTKNGGAITGVIGKKPIHLLSNEDRKKALELHMMWVDTGLDYEDLKSLVAIGAPVVLMPNIVRLGNHRVSGKALDNKIGVFTLMLALKRLAERKMANHTVCGVATVQEEVGCRGAAVASYDINPDISITIDVEFATDVPDCDPKRYGDVCLGKGVVLSCNLDNNMEMYQKMVRTAEDNDIPYQISARPSASGGTNSSRIQLSRSGVRTVSIGIPCRYMHTPVELCDLRDVDSAVRLIVAFCENTDNCD